MFKNYIKKFYLEDKGYLNSQFTFGFEFEGYIKFNDFDDFQQETNDFWSETGISTDDYSKRYANGSWDDDCTIEPPGTHNSDDDDDYDDYGDPEYSTFEWKSPVLEATSTNFIKAIKFLRRAREMGCRTNHTCGFHVHIGFPDNKTSVYDINWTILQLVNSGKLKKMTSFKGFNFLRLWAKDQRFVYIKSNLEALVKDLKGKDINSQESYQIIYDKLQDTFEDNKRDVVSQHPSGTMEWRGPTGIMDDNKAIDHINDFFKYLLSTIAMLSDLLNTQSLDLGKGVVIKKATYLKVIQQNIKNITFAKNPNSNSIFSSEFDKQYAKNLFSAFPSLRSAKNAKNINGYADGDKFIITDIELNNEGKQTIVLDGNNKITFKAERFVGIELQNNIIIKNCTIEDAHLLANCKFINCHIIDVKGNRNNTYENCIIQLWTSSYTETFINSQISINPSVYAEIITPVKIDNCTFTNTRIVLDKQKSLLNSKIINGMIVFEKLNNIGKNNTYDDETCFSYDGATLSLKDFNAEFQKKKYVKKAEEE